MWVFILRRVLLMIPTLMAVSVIAFMIIEAPPGDYMDAYVTRLIQAQQAIDPSEIAALRARYGLDDPGYVRYFRWLSNMLQGDMGRSLEWNQPVTKLIGQRLAWSVLISLFSLVLAYGIAIPIGLYSATHQYSPGDYAFTFVGLIGLAVPNFLLALILLWYYFLATGNVALGLFSDEYVVAPWSVAKFLDLLNTCGCPPSSWASPAPPA